MKYNSLVSIFIVLSLILGISVVGYGGSGGEEGSGSTIVTEQWESIADRGYCKGNWTLVKKSTGLTSVDGDWQYSSYDLMCPFSGGEVTISGSSFSFTASGTATNSSAPVGYQQSPFKLTVEGKTSNGQGSGTYKILFFVEHWPPSISGKWTATRTSSGGITE